jgi:hypothetical protein
VSVPDVLREEVEPQQPVIARRDAAILDVWLRVRPLFSVLLRILIELRFAARRAEVVGLAVVLTLACCRVLVDCHVADRIFDHNHPPGITAEADEV